MPPLLHFPLSYSYNYNSADRQEAIVVAVITKKKRYDDDDFCSGPTKACCTLIADITANQFVHDYKFVQTKQSFLLQQLSVQLELLIISHLFSTVKEKKR